MNKVRNAYISIIIYMYTYDMTCIQLRNVYIYIYDMNPVQKHIHIFHALHVIVVIFTLIKYLVNRYESSVNKP